MTIDTEGFGYARSRKRKVDCNAVYKLIDERLWWRLLEGKRLAIVGGHADELAARLSSREFDSEDAVREVSWTVTTTAICPPLCQPKHSHLSRLQDMLFGTDWDLLLCSSGSLAAVLCEQARLIGRRAIDIGAGEQRLLTRCEAARVPEPPGSG